MLHVGAHAELPALYNHYHCLHEHIHHVVLCYGHVLAVQVQRSPSGQLQGAPGVLGPAQDPSSALL